MFWPRTIARELAMSEAKVILPQGFTGNALALLQAVYRNDTLELGVRLDAAKSAMAYEQPKPEFAAPAGDMVPLHERIRAYARERTIEA